MGGALSTVLVLVSVASFLAAAVIAVALVRVRGAAGAPARTAPKDRARVIEAAIGLAIHMCRADGQLTAEEMEAIETFVARVAPDVGPRFAQETIDRVLRATIRREAVPEAIDQLNARAGSDDRRLALQLLLEVAGTDNVISEHETAFFTRVARRMGHEPPEIEALLARS